MIEAVTLSPYGGVDGSALFRVVGAYGSDYLGRFIEAESCGASQAHATVILSLGFPRRAQAAPGGILHLCRAGAHACQQTFGHRHVFHVDTLRWRDLTLIGEAWATNLPPLPARVQEAEVVLDINFEDRIEELRRRLMGSREPRTPRRRAASSPSDRLAARAEQYSDAHDRGRRRHRSRSRSASTESVFRDAQSSGGLGADAIRLQAERTPGSLWSSAVSEIESYLGQRGVALPAEMKEPSKFVTYLTAVFHGMYPQEKIGPRSSRELRTIAEALDALGSGNLPKTADLLVQRFKAVEESVRKGNWDDSSFLELIQRDSVGLTSTQERLAAQRGRLLDMRLTGKAAPRG